MEGGTRVGYGSSLAQELLRTMAVYGKGGRELDEGLTAVEFFGSTTTDKSWVIPHYRCNLHDAGGTFNLNEPYLHHTACIPGRHGRLHAQ